MVASSSRICCSGFQCLPLLLQMKLWNLGSDLAFQVKVVTAVRSSLPRAAVCCLGTGLGVAVKTRGRAEKKREESTSREFSGF